MSILLDALKKSEEQRQLGKVPDIHSPGGGGPIQRPQAQRWVILLLLVVSAFAVAWFGWRQFQSPGSGNMPGEEVTAAAPENAPADPVAMDPVSAASAQPAGDTPITSEIAPRRTPVEKLPAESAGSAAAAAAAPRPTPEPRKSRVNQSFTAFEAGEQAPADAREPPASTAPAARQPTAATTPASPAAQAAPATGRAQSESKATQPISYWELPQGIRDSLPDLHITVLVYAEDPQARFVLVGGQRLVEKDQFQEGIVLEEIRREGAVFLYRNYRFLVKG